MEIGKDPTAAQVDGSTKFRDVAGPEQELMIEFAIVLQNEPDLLALLHFDPCQRERHQALALLHRHHDIARGRCREPGSP